MGYVNYANYSNAATEIDDSAKKWPLDLPFNSTYFNADGTVKADTKLDGETLKQLRQHAKAVKIQFGYAGSPTYTRVSDTEVADSEIIEQEHLNEQSGVINGTYSGLLDEMSEMGMLGSVGPVVEGEVITKSKIDEIATRLKQVAAYANYSNYTDSPAPSYLNGYQNHSNSHSSNTRSYTCHRNHGNHSNTGSSHLNTATAYANLTYLNVFTNPATYQDNL